MAPPATASSLSLSAMTANPGASRMVDAHARPAGTPTQRRQPRHARLLQRAGVHTTNGTSSGLAPSSSSSITAGANARPSEGMLSSPAAPPPRLVHRRQASEPPGHAEPRPIGRTPVSSTQRLHHAPPTTLLSSPARPRMTRHHSTIGTSHRPTPHDPPSQGLHGRGGPRSATRVLIGANGVMTSNPLVISAAPGTGATGSPTSRSGISSSGATAAIGAGAAPTEDVLRRIFVTYLPSVFEALAKYQYQQATAALERQDESVVTRPDWRGWDAFVVMIRLTASCESTYHLMRYLEPEMVHSETLDQLYHKLVVLLNHLVEDIQPVIKRVRAHEAVRSQALEIAQASGGALTELERLTTGDLTYYGDLLDQAADFFALRIPMIELYRGLATQPPPHEYAGMAKTLDRLLQRYSLFDHPLLATLKQSTIEELRTVKTAFESEGWITQYEFTKSTVALHRFKVALRAWSDHIDAVTEYPLFDDSEDDDLDYVISGSTYSNATSVCSSSLYVQGMLQGDSEPAGRGSSCHPAIRRRSFTQVAAADSLVQPEPSTSAQESQNPFSRLLAQKGSLLKRGFSVSSLRSRSFIGRDQSQPCATPTNTLEHAILGSTPGVGSTIGSNTLTPSGNQLGSAVGISGSGFNSTNSQTIAAEMMASAIAKQEREDGYALPVYQWSKRFYRSLVAKHTLYFHRWLEPFERRGDTLSPYDLTRFIRCPVGISYLQLIDVLLTKGSYKGEDGSATVVLILETEKLENKGSSYFPRGYFCPSSSNPALVMATKSELVRSDVPKTNSLRRDDKLRAVDQTPSSTGEMPRGKDYHRSCSDGSDGSGSHRLFSNVEPETEDIETSEFAPLWGLRGWPAVFSYPSDDAPLEHWPNIISLIMDNRQAFESPRRTPLIHTERRLKTSYYIARVDPAVFLVLLLEGKRRPSEKVTQDFMQTMLDNLQHLGVFDPRQFVAPG